MNYRQVDMIRAALDHGESLTVLDAMTRFGCYALSQRCSDLRREGYPVEMSWETLPNGKRIARYYKMLIAYG